MNKKLGMVFICLLCTSLFCVTEYPETIKDIDDIPDMCAYLMMNLFQQKCDQFDRSRRLLQIKYLNDGEICAYLTLNIGLGLLVYACKSTQAQDEQDQSMGELILLPSEGTFDYKDDIYMRLKRMYINAMEVLKWNWIFVASGKSGSLAYPNMPNNYLAYSKTKQLQGEADLIMSLAHKFGLGRDVVCSDSDRFPYENEGIVYLWFKKDAKRRFDRVFKFKHV